MTFEAKFLIQIAQELSIQPLQVERTIALLADGATIPFIARYRKEVTGNLDEKQIRAIEDKYHYFTDMMERRETVLNTIREQGKLTPELEQRIMDCMDKAELEDLYLPYKPKRRTKAMIAKERGLEPLADALQAQAPGAVPEELAAAFVDLAKEVPDVDAALEGARHIISERAAENSDVRAELRERMMTVGIVVSRKTKDEPSKFEMYYDFQEPVASIPSHRMLAVRRGATEGFLAFEIELPSDDAVIGAITQRYVTDAGSACAAQLAMAVEDAYKRLLNPSIQTEVRAVLKERSDEDAIRVFEENLANLLLSPPAGSLAVMGIDPGVRTGCKVAVVDATGKFLEHAVIYPIPPHRDEEAAARILFGLIKRHGVQGIAIGNGTASRETERFVRSFLRQTELPVFSVVVSESGASVYSASELAAEEHPDLDVTVRGAISIARRLQDPLAELVKIDPKSIGVGQYQHDVDQKRLREGLERTVESCVNRVGVELNTASWALLRYTAGISERIAKRIVEYRDANGPFQTRQDILNISGLGPKAFEQAAGFLRIRGGVNPLDNTGVHPESYHVVSKMAEALGVSVIDLVGSTSLVNKLDLARLADPEHGIGEYTLQDIIQELRKPGRDPRQKFVAPSFRDDVNELTDLQPGMRLQGTVTNVTRFGAFVDIGVHQDGLVHVSELDHKFVTDPSEVVKAGQVIEVQVLEVDVERRRIALSRKACLEPAERKPAPRSKDNRQQQGAKPAARQKEPPQRFGQNVMSGQLQALQSKFKK